MIYDEAEIRERIRLGEDSGCEFKQIEFAGDTPRRPRRDDLADEIAALANAGGGLLLCGVTDDGRVPGMTRGQIAMLGRLVAEISTDSIKPPVRVRTHNRTLDDNTLLVVEVPQGDAAHDSPGGSFVRVASTKRPMTSDERLRLAQHRGQARFRSFDEQTLSDTGFRTLDESLWKPLLSAEGASNPEEGLTRLALVAPDHASTLRATVAGVLLCTRNPEQWLQNARVTATRYRGGDRASGQVDAQEITGPLNQQIREAVAFVARNMQVSARKDPARVDLPQYSLRAVFEAVSNAVMHRDYSIRASAIRVSMFSDRLEIQSPGSLANNLTPESMASRQATRNEVLASVLGRVPVSGMLGADHRRYIMERRGDGVPIILRDTRKLVGQPAEYRLIDRTDLLLRIPAAGQEPSPATTSITVRSGASPLAGVDLLVLFPNGTWRRARSDTDGAAAVELHTTHLPMTVFAAVSGYSATVERDWVPRRRALALNLDALPNGGAVIFPEATGRVPGLSGSLNPIRDALDRTYLYASNIAINDGEPQPVHFLLGERIRLVDSNGTRLEVRVVDVVGRSAIIEYGM
ncbi:MAG: putative DNA binding domain-containing protein [Gammaproteobacteria bacterium]|nr:putative DNA binding domain-containing protein [Gammaproteobacteria bacterium]